MRTDHVEFSDLPRLAEAGRAAGAPFAEALEAAAASPRAEQVLSEIDDLADRMQSDLTESWRRRLDERYATFGRVIRVVIASTLFAILPTAILLVAFMKVPWLALPAFVLIPLTCLAVGLAVAEVGARRDYAAAAAQFDAAFDVLDAAVLARHQSTCPVGARQILLSPYRSVFSDESERIDAAA